MNKKVSVLSIICKQFSKNVTQFVVKLFLKIKLLPNGHSHGPLQLAFIFKKSIPVLKTVVCGIPCCKYYVFKTDFNLGCFTKYVSR